MLLFMYHATRYRIFYVTFNHCVCGGWRISWWILSDPRFSHQKACIYLDKLRSWSQEVRRYHYHLLPPLRLRAVPFASLVWKTLRYRANPWKGGHYSHTPNTYEP